MNRIEKLEPGEVFVFGSNLAGIHGAGAAKQAHKQFGAVWGEGIGMQGRSYAIPTKDHRLRSLPLPTIAYHVREFLRYAVGQRQRFLVTPIGCGLAGYTPEQIAPMFRDAPANVVLPPEFLQADTGTWFAERND